MDVVKHTRTEFKEDRRGRVRERTVTTWDVVENGHLLSEHNRQKDALEARYQLRRQREAEPAK